MASSSWIHHSNQDFTHHGRKRIMSAFAPGPVLDVNELEIQTVPTLRYNHKEALEYSFKYVLLFHVASSGPGKKKKNAHSNVIDVLLNIILHMIYVSFARSNKTACRSNTLHASNGETKDKDHAKYFLF